MISNVELPSLELAQLQHAWLRSARSRMLRHCNLLSSRTIIELGCGWGLATMEIAERVQLAKVIGLDSNADAIGYARNQIDDKLKNRVEFQIGNATELPLSDHSVDIVFSQCAFLWFQDVDAVLREAARVLRPGGWLVTIEPDYGGLMEWPAELSLRSLWLETLEASGAQPLIGRTLFGKLKQLGWNMEARFLDFYEEPRRQAIDFLAQLPLSQSQSQRLETVKQHLGHNESSYVAHLPFWMITAQR